MDGSRELLLRPEPLEGESWAGFLLRISHKNGFRHVAEMAQSASFRFEELIACQPNVALARLGFRTDRDCASAYDNKVEWRLRKQMSTFGRSLYGRVCSHCLREDQRHFIPLHWDNPVQLTCIRHGVLLVDRCDKCNLAIDYLRPSIDHCKCGRDFRLVRTADAPGWWHRTYSLFEVTEPAQVILATFSPFDTISADIGRALLRLVKLVPGTSRKQLSPNGRHTAKLDLVRVEDLPHLEIWIRDWPNGFRENLAKAEHAGFKISSRFLKLGQFPRLHDELLAHTHQRVRMKRPVTITDASKKMMDEGYVGIKTFLTQTRATYDQFNYWLEIGLLRGVFVRKGPGHTQRFFIPRQEFESALICMRQTASLKEASKLFGASKRVLRAMGYANVFRKVELNRGKYAFRLNILEVSTLVRALVDSANSKAPYNLVCVPVSEAVLACAERNDSLVKTFIEELKAGSFPLYRAQRSAVYFDDLQMGGVEFKNWLGQRLMEQSHV